MQNYSTQNAQFFIENCQYVMKLRETSQIKFFFSEINSHKSAENYIHALEVSFICIYIAILIDLQAYA